MQLRETTPQIRGHPLTGLIINSIKKWLTKTLKMGNALGAGDKGLRANSFFELRRRRSQIVTL